MSIHVIAGGIAEKRELLAHVGMFSELDATELERIAQYSEFLELESNERLFSEGDPGNSLYVVKSGSIVISQTQGESKQVDIAEFVADECFGELDLLHGAARTANARCEAPSELLRFPGQGTSFEEILRVDPATSARLLQKLIIAIANRIRETNSLISQKSPWVEQLRTQVFGDKLTGMFNRSYLHEELPRLLRDDTAPFALLMIKPDNFKIINDTYGHDAGDMTLRLIAATVRTWAGDFTSVRFRGNEMAVLLPSTDRDRALRYAEELRQRLCDLDLEPATGSSDVAFPFSVGVALYPEDAADAESLIERSSQTLFAARESGANRTLSANQA
ncbi:MAG: diguanylate cyclase domain-containing protein [Spirochaetales bacterium]